MSEKRDPLKRKAWQAAYIKRPDVKARNAAHQQIYRSRFTPDQKEWRRLSHRHYMHDNVDQIEKMRLSGARRYKDLSPEQKAIRLANHRARYRERRELAIKHYGGKCFCCGESAYEFLAFDHVDGGGNKHRAETGEGSAFLNWLRKNNYPPIVRVACHNCNAALGSYGFCPHQRKLAAVAA